MTINSSTDHGYVSEPAPVTVRVGDLFRQECALGVYESRVLRAHRDAGYFETVFERWITEVPEFRRGFVGSIHIESRHDILCAMLAD